MSDTENDNPNPVDYFADPRTGYWGKAKMMKKYRMVLNNLYAVQRHRQVRKKTLRKQHKRETAPHPFASVQVDLAFLPKLRSPLNHNVWGFMVVIDVFSRYLWIKTFTNRKSLQVPLRHVLEQMKKQFNKTPMNVTGDNEFATTRLQALAGEYNFKWWFGDAHEKFRTGMSEKVISTMKNLIKRYLTHNNTTKYIDVLPQLVKNYNDTIHSSTNTRPSVAIRTEQTFPKPYQKQFTDLNVGDIVRVLEPRTAFTKGDVPYYSKDEYEIVGRDKNRYIVKNLATNQTLRKRFGRHQLYKIKDTIKAQSKPDRVGYDEGIERNERRNRITSALQREGIAVDPQIDDVTHEELEPRIDDVNEKYDKLSIYKYQQHPTSANGACFFNSLAGYLHWEKNKNTIKPGSSTEKHMASFLRKQIVQYIKKKLDSKIPQLEETFYDNIHRQLENEHDDRDVKTYLNDMLKTSEWAGQTEIIAASLYLKRNILVYVKKSNNYIKHGGYIYDDNDNNIITLFWNQSNPNTEGTHYEYLTPREQPLQPPSDLAPRRSHRARKQPQQYISQQPKAKIILPKDYKDKDGYTADYWGDENIGNWVEDKRKDGWLWIRKIKGELRYRGVYDRLADDKFIERPLSDDSDSQPIQPSSLKPSKAQLKERHKKKRMRRKLRLKDKINNVAVTNVRKKKTKLSDLINNL